jgi:hypothetical protein
VKRYYFFGGGFEAIGPLEGNLETRNDPSARGVSPKSDLASLSRRDLNRRFMCSVLAIVAAVATVSRVAVYTFANEHKLQAAYSSI